MLLDTYFYHLPRAIPAHECEEIIEYGKSLNPKDSKTSASSNMLSNNEKKEHNEKIRNSKTAFISSFFSSSDNISLVDIVLACVGFKDLPNLIISSQVCEGIALGK